MMVNCQNSSMAWCTFILTNPGSNSCHNWKTHEMLIFGHPRSLHFTWFLKFCIVSRSFVFGVTYVILCSFLCYSFRFYKTFGHSGEELHWTRLWLRQRSVQLSRCSLSSQAARNCDLCVCSLYRCQIPSEILLMEEILHHLGYINLVNNGINGSSFFQLVQDFFQQYHWGELQMSRLCGFSLLRLWLPARGGHRGMSVMEGNQRKHHSFALQRDVITGHWMFLVVIYWWILLNSEIHIQGNNIQRYTKNHFV